MSYIRGARISIGQYVYHLDDIEDQLDQGHPVIFSAFQTKHILGVPFAVHGHAWVVDGYRDWIDCNPTGEYLSFHMNWGWIYAQYDGWYGFNNLNPGGDKFDRKITLILNIKPNINYV